jgi:hypothetical protein
MSRGKACVPLTADGKRIVAHVVAVTKAVRMGKLTRVQRHRYATKALQLADELTAEQKATPRELALLRQLALWVAP